MHETLNEQRLIELLRHQQVLYRRLRQLADRQKALVIEDDTVSLIDVLAERQKLVDGLMGLSGKLAPYRAQWAEIYGNLEEATRQEVAKLLEEANQSLGAIISSDSRDSATLTARRHGMATELAECTAGGRVNSAYGATHASGVGSMTEARA